MPDVIRRKKGDFWKNEVIISREKNVVHSYRNFESLYLNNRLRYQGESKNDFNGIVSSLCSEWVLMDFA